MIISLQENYTKYTAVSRNETADNLQETRGPLHMRYYKQNKQRFLSLHRPGDRDIKNAASFLDSFQDT